MTTGKLGAWGPTSRGATHKRRITLDVDRPKRSSWPGYARRFSKSWKLAAEGWQLTT